MGTGTTRIVDGPDNGEAVAVDLETPPEERTLNFSGFTAPCPLPLHPTGVVGPKVTVPTNFPPSSSSLPVRLTELSGAETEQGMEKLEYTQCMTAEPVKVPSDLAVINTSSLITVML
jgi:hypothetical protein